MIWPAAPWTVWVGLPLLGAWLATDENSLIQTWLSQPLPAAILTGAVLGDPTAALLPGILMQLVVVGNLPVGASFRLDAASATVGVTGGALLAGWHAGGHPLATAAWTGVGGMSLGWLLVMTVLASLCGGWLVHGERRARLGWMLDGYRSVRDGDVARLERLHARCLLVTAARGAALTVVWMVLTASAWQLDPLRLPGPILAALGIAPLLVPALAVGSVSERFGPRRAWPLVGSGLAVGFLVAWLVV